MDLLLWGLTLLGIAVILTVVEVFVPSAGAIAITAAVVAIAGVVCLFQLEDKSWGVGGALSFMVLWPSIFFGGLHLWRSTKAGRRAMGMPTEEEMEQARLAELSERNRWQALVGQEGLVLTDLRPVGKVEVHGQRYDALSDIAFVAAGSRVRVTQAGPGQVRVRPV